MLESDLIHQLVEEKELVMPLLFKPIQFEILEKLDQRKSLTPNEQRYLRGKVRRKLQVLQKLCATESPEKDLTFLLDTIGSYYITGLAALKHHGYGWFYEPKIIEIINTRLQGKLIWQDTTFKFIRVKSISKKETAVDSETGLHYASNDQVYKDISLTKNRYTQTVWQQMYTRYGTLFARNKYPLSKEVIDYQKNVLQQD